MLTKARMILMFTLMATSDRKTLESIVTPSSVNANGEYALKLYWGCQVG